jgi:MotA/MotB-like proton-channel complex protein
LVVQKSSQDIKLVDFKLGENNDIFKKKKNDGWKALFFDLISLMITFFVLIYSMSTTSKGKWDEVTEYMRDSFNPDRERLIAYDRRVLDVEYMYQLFNRKLKNEPELSELKVTMGQGKLTISIPMDTLFEKNSLKLSLKARSIIYFIANTMYDIENEVAVNAVTNLSYVAKPGTDIHSAVGVGVLKAGIMAREIKEASNLDRIQAFVLSSEFNKIAPKMAKGKLINYYDRIEIVIHDEQSED